MHVTGRRMGLLHLNGNILCSIDVETSGDIPGEDDLLQVALVPLNYMLDPWEQFSPFYFELKPKRPENYERLGKKKHRELYCRAQINGVDPDRAADLFEEWVAKFNLAFGKKIVPLSQNWPHDRGFIIDWLGNKGFSDFFDVRYRDTMMYASAINDREDLKVEQAQFTRVGLRDLCRYFAIENPHPHDALSDALATAKVYKKLLAM